MHVHAYAYGHAIECIYAYAYDIAIDACIININIILLNNPWPQR